MLEEPQAGRWDWAVMSKALRKGVGARTSPQGPDFIEPGGVSNKCGFHSMCNGHPMR